jgi:hypothetical protein
VEEGPGYGKIPSAPRAPARSTGGSAGGRRGQHINAEGNRNGNDVSSLVVENGLSSPRQQAAGQSQQGAVVTGGISSNIVSNTNTENTGAHITSPRSALGGTRLTAKSEATKNKAAAQGSFSIGQR